MYLKVPCLLDQCLEGSLKKQLQFNVSLAHSHLIVLLPPQASKDYKASYTGRTVLITEAQDHRSRKWLELMHFRPVGSSALQHGVPMSTPSLDYRHEALGAWSGLQASSPYPYNRHAEHLLCGNLKNCFNSQIQRSQLKSRSYTCLGQGTQFFLVTHSRQNYYSDFTVKPLQ